MIQKIKGLSNLEIKWLNSMGGRNKYDAQYDREKKRYFITMYRLNGELRIIYIPTWPTLNRMFNTKKDGTKREDNIQKTPHKDKRIRKHSI